jgi:hypothetical protein
MKNANFEIIFIYANILSNHPNEDKKRKVTTTTCEIRDVVTDSVLSTATITPHHNQVEDRLVARKITFQRALHNRDTASSFKQQKGKIPFYSREERINLWRLFQKNTVQPENGRVRLKSVIAQLYKLPGLTVKDFGTIAESLRRATTRSKSKLRKLSEEEVTESQEVVENFG